MPDSKGWKCWLDPGEWKILARHTAVRILVKHRGTEILGHRGMKTLAKHRNEDVD